MAEADRNPSFLGLSVNRQALLAAGVTTLLWITPLGMATSFAQTFFRQSSQPGRFIEAPRSVQQQLREAERALSQGEDTDAVVRLGDLLQRDPRSFDDADLVGQDFFSELDEGERPSHLVQESVLRKARAMIGDLSRAARETYELRYGPLANKLLSDAAATRDWETVGEVRRKYFHTKAGYRASYLLAQRELHRGRALAASILLDEVVTSPLAVEHLGEAVQQMHRDALRMSGRSDSAIDESVYAEEEFVRRDPEDYHMLGGRPDRNGLSSSQMPLSRLRWELRTTGRARQERTLAEIESDLAATGNLPPPSWIPLRVGDQLLMRMTDRLVGVDFRTGCRVWTWPWSEPDRSLSMASAQVEEDPEELLSQRVWNDLPYGQVTSDGERVYLLDDLGAVESASYGPFRGTRPADKQTNTLVALDLATEGKILWRCGAGANDGSDLAEAFFLGPPLPLDGKLYVMHELAGDINLSCLDPLTGVEQWRQQLVAVETGGIETDPIRRVAGAMPTFHQGLLICPTGAGALVALDLHDRMLRWGVSFSRNREMMNTINGSRGLETTQLMKRWHTGTAIASGNSLIVTPVESDRLMVLDVLSGERRFAEKNRVQLRYVAGVRDGKFFAVGSKQVRAFDLNTGASEWTTPPDMLAAGQQIIGRGIFGENDYLLPTSTNQLIRISLDRGEVLERRHTKYPLGNLVAVGGEVIVQGPAKIAVARGQASLEPWVTEMLAKEPDHFQALVRKAELLIQEGRRRDALEWLARAREIDPLDDDVHLLSVSAMLGALRENLDAEGELVETLDRLIDQPTERAEFLSLRARGAIQSSDFVEAIEHLIELSAMLPRLTQSEVAADQIVGETLRHCSLDGWISARARQIHRDSGDQSDDVNLRLLSYVDRNRGGSDAFLQRIVRHFGSLPGSQAAREDFGVRLSNSGDLLRLERLPLGVSVPDRQGYETLPTGRLLRLASIYTDQRMLADARIVLAVLAERDDLDEPQTTARDELAGKGSEEFSPEWPRHVSLEWQSQQFPSRAFSSTTEKVALTRLSAGEHFRNWRLVSNPTNPLAVRDQVGQLRPITLESFDRSLDGDKEAQICGSFMVALLRTQIVGVDLHRVVAGNGGAVLWERGLSGDGTPIADRQSVTLPFDDRIYRYYIKNGVVSSSRPEFRLGPILGDRVVVLQGGDLMALNLETGKPIWRNSAAPRSGFVVARDGRIAVVSAAEKKVIVFDALDGRILDSKRWERGDIWAAAGSHVLCFKKAGREAQRTIYDVQLVDAFTDDVRLSCTSIEANRTNSALPSSYGRVIAGRYLVMLDTDGQGTLWDLRSGQEIARPKLPAYADLRGVEAVLLNKQLIILPKRRLVRTRPQDPVTFDNNHVTSHAVHAISLTDGNIRWSREFDSPWGCTLHQPADTPILLFTRGTTTPNGPPSSRRKSLDVLALDVRDGSEKNKATGKPVSTRSDILETRLSVQHGLSQVVVQIGGELLTYKFTDQPSARNQPE